MKHARLLGFASALCLLALPAARADNTLKLGSGTAEFGTEVSIPLTLSTTDEVQGLVAAFKWDGSAGTGVDLITAASLAEADTVVTRVEADYMVLGVVMDSDPLDPGSPEVVGPGDDILLATAVIQCGPGPDETTTPIVFADGEFATVDGGPLLDNIVVVGGLSIGRLEGLNLIDGEFRCIPTPDKLIIESGGNEGDRCGEIRVLMQNMEEVEGFVTAICHRTPELELTDITLGADAAQADFAESEIDPSVGGTFGVVIDLFDPMAMPPNIQPGSDNHIATYTYCCVNPPAGGEPETVFNLEFCDNEIGDPLKENLIVIGGRSKTVAEDLVLVNGTFTCGPVGPPPPEDCDNGVDDDGDGLVDLEDPDCQTAFLCGGRDLSQDSNGDGIPDVVGQRGREVEVCFYIKTPEDNLIGQHAQPDHIQGFSMAVSYCCDLQVLDESLDISGTILEALGAEFVSVQADNDPDDGDGCELIIGVLVDALPPFDGATIPPLPDPQRVGCVTFSVSEEAECDTKCAIEFTDGLNGRGKVPIKNLVSAENKSRAPGQLVNCQVCIVEEERFHRGDCNFSLMGNMAVDIADAAAVVSFVFLPGTWKFQPGCLDACDCNDDGRVDLADAICILQFLFQFGNFPPDPGPGFDMDGNDLPPGPDPTPDKLDCVLGRACELQPDP